jgi:hypothetical protein
MQRRLILNQELEAVPLTFITGWGQKFLVQTPTPRFP